MIKDVLNQGKMIILVLVLSFFPLFIYSHLGTLVVDSLSSTFQTAGYLGYLPLNVVNFLVLIFCFSISTLPIIYKYSSKYGSFFIWIITISFSLIVSVFITGFFGLLGLIPFGMLLGISIAQLIILKVFISITSSKIPSGYPYVLSFFIGVFAVILSYLLGGLELIGTWGGIPIFKMITLIGLNIFVSMMLLFVAIKYTSNKNLEK